MAELKLIAAVAAVVVPVWVMRPYLGLLGAIGLGLVILFLGYGLRSVYDAHNFHDDQM